MEGFKTFFSFGRGRHGPREMPSVINDEDLDTGLPNNSNSRFGSFGIYRDDATDADATFFTNPTNQDMGDYDEDDPVVMAVKVQQNTHADGFGDKSISLFGGLCLLINNITGPALVNIPVVYQQAGWMTCTFGMLLVMVVAGFSATMLCKAMAMVPGNDRFQGRIELSGLARHYFPKWGYYLTLLLLIISLQATNIASIIISAQTADFTLVAIFNWVGGVEVYPHPGWATAHEAGDSNSPFGNVIILSLGFVLVLITAIPLGYFNLDDNIFVQVIAFFSMLAIVVCIWTVDCFLIGLDFDRVPMVTTNQAQLLGVIIFNFAFVTSVPSWVNEKKDKVSVNKSLWVSTLIATVVFIWMGLFCGWAFYYTGNNNVLDVVSQQSSGKFMKILAKVSVYAFPEVVLVSSIPVFSIIVRYNLLESRLMGKHWANFWSVIVPWVIAVPFYTGSGLNNILSWVGLIVNGVINFIIPLLLYIAALRRYPAADRPDKFKMVYSASSRDAASIGSESEENSFGDNPATSINSSAPVYSTYSNPSRLQEGVPLIGTNNTDTPTKTFHAVPLWVQNYLHIKPLYVAIVLAVAITIGIVANAILDFVYLGLGQNLVG